MTKETLIRIRRIYSILLSVVIIVAGLCLIAGCITIYSSGEQPFSREIVAETFSGIAVWIYLSLGMTALSILLEIILFFVKEEKVPLKDKTNYPKYNGENDKKENLLRLTILFLAVFFVVYGLITGGTADVLTKAINICTECIGLG